MGGTVSVGTDSESPRSRMAIVSVEHQASTNSCFKTQGPFGDQPLAPWCAPWLQGGKAQLGSVNHDSVGQAYGCAAQA